MWKIPIISALLLRIKRRRVTYKPLIMRSIDNNKFVGNISRVTLQEWKEAIQQKDTPDITNVRITYED